MEKKHFNINSTKKHAPERQYAEPKRTYKKTEQENTSAPDPEMEALNRNISDMLIGQIKDFMKGQDDIETMSTQDRIDRENRLFCMDYPTHCENINGGTLLAYMVDRSVRVDRETHKLKRASCTIIINDVNGATTVPAYCVTAYVTQQKTGTISFVRLGKNGPEYRSSIRTGINEEMF